MELAVTDAGCTSTRKSLAFATAGTCTITLLRFWIMLTPDNVGAEVKLSFPPDDEPPPVVLAVTVTVELTEEDVPPGPVQASV